MDRWYPSAERVQTAAYWPGFDPAFPAYKAAMIHIMQGYQRTMIGWAQQRPPAGQTLDQAIKAGTVLAKSAHATIGRSGRLVQHVALGDRSWAAGRACSERWPLIEPSQASSVPIDRRRSINHTVVNIECEGFSKPPGYAYDYVYDASHPWPAPLIGSLVDWLVWFFQQTGLTPGPDTIIGHRDTDGCTRADDPGWAFPMASVQAIVAARLAGGAPAPAEPPEGSTPPATDLGPLTARLEAQEAAITLLKGDAEAQQAQLALHEARLNRHLTA